MPKLIHPRPTHATTAANVAVPKVSRGNTGCATLRSTNTNNIKANTPTINKMYV